MRIVDLFSGAGGLTFGFYYKLLEGAFIKNNDNEFVFANEVDCHAAEAFRMNFPDINMICEDVKTLDEARILGLVGNLPVDIIIGGPPCQSFSTIGKRRYDDKAKLYIEYMRLLRIIRPKMFLFENVKGMLSMHEQIPVLDNDGNEQYDEEGKIITRPGRLILDVIKDQFNTLDENCQLGYTLVGESILDAVDYGVPQHRERVFLVGARNDLLDRIHWTYPRATHGEELERYITLQEAISDFPSLSEGEKKSEYLQPPRNQYQTLMRAGSNVLSQHYCGIHNEKIRRVIEAVPQGKGRNYINELVERGDLPAFCKLTSGYKNTYGRLVEDRPSTTITNNMCTPSALRCIHYREHRTLSPREGARIQSFPDWFVFCGARVNVTSQIGNAVPPLLALQIARQIESIIDNLNEQEEITDAE